MNALILLLAAAGGIGAALRYLVDRLLSPRDGMFPVGILVVNVSGSLALGMVTGLGTALEPQIAMTLGIGLLGGYTTFSAVAVDAVVAAESRQMRRAIGIVLGNLLLATGAAAAGWTFASWIVTAG